MTAHTIAFANGSVTGKEHENGNKYIRELQAYIEGIKNAPDFRLEVVHTFRSFTDVHPGLWDANDREHQSVAHLLNFLIRNQ